MYLLVDRLEMLYSARVQCVDAEPNRAGSGEEWSLHAQREFRQLVCRIGSHLEVHIQIDLVGSSAVSGGGNTAPSLEKMDEPRQIGIVVA